MKRMLALLVTVGAIVAMVPRPALATNYTIVYGGAADDRIEGGPGPQEIRGKQGDDFLIGGKSPDVLRGGKGDDNLWSGLGGVPDQVYGGPGDDKLNNFDSGQAGQVLDGGHGFDICTGDKHDTFVSCEVVRFR